MKLLALFVLLLAAAACVVACAARAASIEAVVKRAVRGDDDDDDDDDDNNDDDDDDAAAAATTTADPDAAEFLIAEAVRFVENLAVGATPVREAFSGMCGVTFDSYATGNTLRTTDFPAGGIEGVSYVGRIGGGATGAAFAPGLLHTQALCATGRDQVGVVAAPTVVFPASGAGQFVIAFSDVVRAVSVRIVAQAGSFAAPSTITAQTALNGGSVASVQFAAASGAAADVNQVWTVSSVDGRVFDEVSFSVSGGDAYCLVAAYVPCVDQHLHNDVHFYSRFHDAYPQDDDSADDDDNELAPPNDDDDDARKRADLSDDDDDDDDGSGDDDDGVAGNELAENAAVDAAAVLITETGQATSANAKALERTFGGNCELDLTTFPANSALGADVLPAGGVESIRFVNAGAASGSTSLGVAFCGSTVTPDAGAISAPASAVPVAAAGSNTMYVIRFSDVVRQATVTLARTVAAPGAVQVMTALRGGNVATTSVNVVNGFGSYVTVASIDGRVFDELALSLTTTTGFCIRAVSIPCIDQHLRNDQHFYELGIGDDDDDDAGDYLHKGTHTNPDADDYNDYDQ